MTITSSDSKSTPLAVWLWDIRLLDVVPSHLRKRETPSVKENIRKMHVFKPTATAEYKHDTAPFPLMSIVIVSVSTKG